MTATFPPLRPISHLDKDRQDGGKFQQVPRYASELESNDADDQPQRLHAPVYPVTIPGFWHSWIYYTSNRTIYLETLREGMTYCRLPAEFRARLPGVECVRFAGAAMSRYAATRYILCIVMLCLVVSAFVGLLIYHGHCARALCRLGCLRRRPDERQANWPGHHMSMTRPAAGAAGLRGELEPRPIDDPVFVEETGSERDRWEWNPNLNWRAMKGGLREWALGLERFRRRLTGWGRLEDERGRRS